MLVVLANTLYFSLRQPSPREVRIAVEYTNGDTDTLTTICGGGFSICSSKIMMERFGCLECDCRTVVCDVRTWKEIQ